jgi:hypothetical protein
MKWFEISDPRYLRNARLLAPAAGTRARSPSRATSNPRNPEKHREFAQRGRFCEDS